MAQKNDECETLPPLALLSQGLQSVNQWGGADDKWKKPLAALRAVLHKMFTGTNLNNETSR